MVQGDSKPPATLAQHAGGALVSHILVPAATSAMRTYLQPSPAARGQTAASNVTTPATKLRATTSNVKTPGIKSKATAGKATTPATKSQPTAGNVTTAATKAQPTSVNVSAPASQIPAGSGEVSTTGVSTVSNIRILVVNHSIVQAPQNFIPLYKKIDPAGSIGTIASNVQTSSSRVDLTAKSSPQTLTGVGETSTRPFNFHVSLGFPSASTDITTWADVRRKAGPSASSPIPGRAIGDALVIVMKWFMTGQLATGGPRMRINPGGLQSATVRFECVDQPGELLASFSAMAQSNAPVTG